MDLEKGYEPAISSPPIPLTQSWDPGEGFRLPYYNGNKVFPLTHTQSQLDNVAENLLIRNNRISARNETRN